jgi:hypothetical protein
LRTKKNNPEELIQEAYAYIGSERRGMMEIEFDIAARNKKKIEKIIAQYSEPLADGFQVKDIKWLLKATYELIEYVEGIGKLEGPQKRELVVAVVMTLYKENGAKLPWYVKWLPDGWIRSGTESAVDSIVEYMNKRDIL